MVLTRLPAYSTFFISYFPRDSDRPIRLIKFMPIAFIIAKVGKIIKLLQHCQIMTTL